MATKSIFCEQTADKAAIISYFYNREEDAFFHRYHKCGGTREECIQDTCESISEESKIFLVFCNTEIAGFFVKNESTEWVILEGFHVLKEFRSRDFLTRFWMIVDEAMSCAYVTAIFKNNFPAIGTLLQAGFTIASEFFNEGKQFVILKNEINANRSRSIGCRSGSCQSN